MEKQNYISRDIELRTIKNHLQSRSGEPIIVSGVVGIGKTSLLYQYVTSYSNEYDFVLFLSLGRFYSQEELKSYMISQVRDLYIKTITNAERPTNNLL
jgi:predicted ATP-dependent serine protease